MSRHNYTQYSKNNDEHETIEVEDVMVPEVPEVPEVPGVTAMAEVKYTPAVDVVVEPVKPEPEPVTGTIANCTKLNIRKNPAATAQVVCVLDAGTELVIDVTRSTSDWFKVSTATGVDGYCMRRFINANL